MRGTPDHRCMRSWSFEGGGRVSLDADMRQILLTHLNYVSTP